VPKDSKAYMVNQVVRMKSLAFEKKLTSSLQ
jgi:hypothetical protein